MPVKCKISAFSRYMNRKDNNNMKRSIKNVWQPTLLTAILLLTAACSTDDSYMPDKMAGFLDDYYSEGSATYEGEWTVNKQVVDTAQLVVINNNIVFRLPEHYLLSTYIIPLFYADKSVNDSPLLNSDSIVSYEPLGIPSEIHFTALGYSESSQYNMVSASTFMDKNVQVLYITCSFKAKIDNTSYLISLLSKEDAMLILQKASGQWTLGIPIDGFLLDNISTDRPTVREQRLLPGTVTIYYNTKRRKDPTS